HHLEAEVAKARARIDEIERSRAWRATAPVRRFAHRIKVLNAQARAGWRGLRRLPQKVSIAATILNDQGAQALAKRVVQKMRGRPAFQAATVEYTHEDAVAPLFFVTVELPRVSIIIP